MQTINLTKVNNLELAALWNTLAKAFEGKGKCEVGFLELSRETRKRGLELNKSKMGNIILQQKPEAVSN